MNGAGRRIKTAHSKTGKTSSNHVAPNPIKVQSLEVTLADALGWNYITQ